MVESKQLAWIGLGNMGRGMTKNLVEKGNLSKPLILFNRSSQRAKDHSTELGSDKTKVAGSIPELVAESDIIFACVGNDAAIKETIGTALENDVKGKLFVDCSTVHPDTSNELTKLITDKGAHFVACPVFGAPAMADAGQLICVLAGPTADVAKVKPFCKGVMGRDEIDFSDKQPSHATLMKLVGNTMILSMVTSLSEGHTVAETSGLGVESFHNFIEKLFGGPFAAYSNSGDYYNREEPLLQVDLAIKDASHALSLASASGAKIVLPEVAKGYLQTVKEEKGQKGDIAGIYGAVRKNAGLPFGNEK